MKKRASKFEGLLKLAAHWTSYLVPWTTESEKQDELAELYTPVHKVEGSFRPSEDRRQPDIGSGEYISLPPEVSIDYARYKNEHPELFSRFNPSTFSTPVVVDNAQAVPLGYRFDSAEDSPTGKQVIPAPPSRQSVSMSGSQNGIYGISPAHARREVYRLWDEAVNGENANAEESAQNADKQYLAARRARFDELSRRHPYYMKDDEFDPSLNYVMPLHKSQKGVGVVVDNAYFGPQQPGKINGKVKHYGDVNSMIPVFSYGHEPSPNDSTDTGNSSAVASRDFSGRAVTAANPMLGPLAIGVPANTEREPGGYGPDTHYSDSLAHEAGGHATAPVSTGVSDEAIESTYWGPGGVNSVVPYYDDIDGVDRTESDDWFNAIRNVGGGYAANQNESAVGVVGEKARWSAMHGGQDIAEFEHPAEEWARSIDNEVARAGGRMAFIKSMPNLAQTMNQASLMNIYFSLKDGRDKAIKELGPDAVDDPRIQHYNDFMEYLDYMFKLSDRGGRGNGRVKTASYRRGFLTKCAEHGIPEHIANKMMDLASVRR